jgi:selenocysteine lyase/cysteine desulfurase
MAKESILSSMPPCPGISVPVSFKPISLLTADTTTSPTKPAHAMTKLTTKDSTTLKGVKNLKKYPKTVVVNTPPIKPSHVLAEILSAENIRKPNLRISWSHYNTKSDIDFLIEALKKI